jgi:hypothetical protein
LPVIGQPAAMAPGPALMISKAGLSDSRLLDVFCNGYFSDGVEVGNTNRRSTTGEAHDEIR